MVHMTEALLPAEGSAWWSPCLSTAMLSSCCTGHIDVDIQHIQQYCYIGINPSILQDAWWLHLHTTSQQVVAAPQLAAPKPGFQTCM